MLIDVKVVPNSKQIGVAEENNRFKVKVRSKPIDGKANAEVIKLLAGHFNVSTANVRIIRGSKSTAKLVEVTV